jgi:hypothetical protein
METLTFTPNPYKFEIESMIIGELSRKADLQIRSGKYLFLVCSKLYEK